MFLQFISLNSSPCPQRLDLDLTKRTVAYLESLSATTGRSVIDIAEDSISQAVSTSKHDLR